MKKWQVSRRQRRITGSKVRTVRLRINLSQGVTLDDLEKLVLGANCGGMLGLLQARTCANPNTAAEEVNYFKAWDW